LCAWGGVIQIVNPGAQKTLVWPRRPRRETDRTRSVPRASCWSRTITP